MSGICGQKNTHPTETIKKIVKEKEKKKSQKSEHMFLKCIISREDGGGGDFKNHFQTNRIQYLNHTIFWDLSVGIYERKIHNNKYKTELHNPSPSEK